MNLLDMNPLELLFRAGYIIVFIGIGFLVSGTAMMCAAFAIEAVRRILS